MCRWRFVKRAIRRTFIRKRAPGRSAGLPGIDAPYDPPDDAEIVVRTDKQTVNESVASILEWLLPRVRVNRHED